MSLRCGGYGVIAVDISPMSEFFTLFRAMFPGGNVANSAVCCGLAPDGTGPGVGILYTCTRSLSTTIRCLISEFNALPNRTPRTMCRKNLQTARKHVGCRLRDAMLISAVNINIELILVIGEPWHENCSKIPVRLPGTKRK